MSSQSDALATLYQHTQDDLAGRVSKLVAAYWAKEMASTDRGTIRAAADRWLALAIPVILRARKQSQQQGRGYYLARRRLEAPDAAPYKPPVPDPLDRKALTTSLWFTGPRDYVDLDRELEDILSEERVNAISGAAIRHALNGGRSQIESAYESDPAATGYYRVEDGDPCYFCAMLMSRGAVFREDSFDETDPRFFGPGDAKVHDHCGGRLEASYNGEKYPGDTKRFNEMWDSGQWNPARNPDGEMDVVLGWRQFYEGRQKS